MNKTPDKLLELFIYLKNSGLKLSIESLNDLKSSLSLGFGLKSSEEFKNLCCLLWAKSKEDIELIYETFEYFDFTSWSIKEEYETRIDSNKPNNIKPIINNEYIENKPKTELTTENIPENKLVQKIDETKEKNSYELPKIFIEENDLKEEELIKIFNTKFIFNQKYQIDKYSIQNYFKTIKKIANTNFNSIEIDVEKTIQKRCDIGVITPALYTNKKNEPIKIMFLIDRRGSMIHFHNFTDYLVKETKKVLGKLNVYDYYFYNLPIFNVNKSPLLKLKEGELFPSLKSIYNDIKEAKNTKVYLDSNLKSIVNIENILKQENKNLVIFIISDAGASNSNYNILRILSSISYFKFLKKYSDNVLWLNPIPKEDWEYSTASYLSESVPMITLDSDSLFSSIKKLRL
ncbi:MAG: hypothetical protein U0457_09810 [Candidatus Sericytochromatia bacterium]